MTKNQFSLALAKQWLKPSFLATLNKKRPA
jgi:hypothetical protein